MNTGHIYILSNDSLKSGLLKIGLTRKTPENRAKQLSRSTSIPGKYNVEFSVQVGNVKLAERRIHLLLKSHRFDMKKEFFSIGLDTARSVAEKVSVYCNCDYKFSGTMMLSNDLRGMPYSMKLGARQMQLVRFMMSQSHNNSILDHLENLPDGIVSGFLSSTSFSEWLSIKDSTARIHLKNFSEKYIDLEVINPFTKSRLAIFEMLDYSCGELAWTFRREIRRLFINQQI